MERIMDNEITYPVAQGTQTFFEKAATAGLELRTGQVKMAMEICEAIIKTTPLAVEAEVGIGKSYAYLIPAVMKYRKDHRQIVIATSTIALQEQLVKDTQNVLKMTGSYIDIILAKGMRNYLCHRRLRMRLKKKDHPEIYDNLNIALRVNGYDRAKMGFNIPDRIWETVNVQNYNEKCHECPLNDTCGYYELRRNLRSGGGIVICNQNMLVAHFQNVSQKGKGIFNPRGGMIIVDEAHNIESRFRDAYTRSFTCAEMIKVINNCIDKTPYNLKRTVEPYANKTMPVVEQLYKRLVRQVKEQAKELEADTSTYYFERDDETMALLKELYNRMVRLENSSKVILKSTLSFLKSALNTSNEYIVWLEMEPKLKICVCKKDIRHHISDQLFPEDATTILTSATISDKADGTPREKCSYFLNNISFPDDGAVSEPKHSPYNYDKNAIIYFSKRLPYPKLDNKEEYRKRSIDELVRLLNVTNGKSLILFTSKEDMDFVYRRLSNMHLPYKILIQGKGSSQAHRLDKFKTDVNSVILGTGTYWEGINVEGESLSQVIIYKLPFPVPDPIIDYKMSIVKDKIKEVAIPEMIIKLKQGAGRLIRCSEDKGIVSILDPRASSMYRMNILNALSEKNSVETTEELAEFWKRISNE